MKQKFTSVFTLAFIILSSFFSVIRPQDKTTESKIDSLLSIMTLEEKIGQLTQLSANSWEFPGKSVISDEQKEAVKKGGVGSFLNLFGAEATREAQKIAIEQSRLKIPIIFGYDVIHGYKTTFPCPIGRSCKLGSRGS